MGLVLDSSVLVIAERQALPVSALLDSLQKLHDATEIVLSVISVVELEHEEELDAYLQRLKALPE